ncbi:MAG: chromate transporter [Paludibacteraceae bacterium]|nr:chromate transporter [Paludibacteraceae bacterium]
MKNLSLFATFFRIGAFTLGGGYAMIPLVQREIVDHQHWIEEEEFLDLIALAQSAPGIIAVNTAVFVGYKINGWRGLLYSVLGAVLPSFVIILTIATCFTHFRDNEAIEAIFKGIRPAVVALIAAPLYKMAKSAKITWKTIIIPIVAAFLIWYLKVSPILIIIFALIAGTIVVWIRDEKERRGKR